MQVLSSLSLLIEPGVSVTVGGSFPLNKLKLHLHPSTQVCPEAHLSGVCAGTVGPVLLTVNTGHQDA